MRGTGVLHSIFAGYTSSAEDFAGHGKDVIRQMLAGTSYANRSGFSQKCCLGWRVPLPEIYAAAIQEVSQWLFSTEQIAL